MIIQAMREFPFRKRYPFDRRLQAGDKILATSLREEVPAATSKDDDDDQRTCMVVHWRAAPGLADRRPQVQALQFALENMSKVMVVVMGRMLVLVLVLWHW